ncbi:MAG TPA: sulfatase-like hydrolase/transferase [Flavisolibacter sp.]|jgi:hypothetical protein|nr:sulfatase-like hydrolase/transferase [Flavisolibacter sp.]
MTILRSRTALFKEWPLLLLPVFFVFHTYTENIQLLPLTIALELLIKYLLAGFLLAILFSYILRSIRKGYIFALLVLSINFFFGPIHDLLKQYFKAAWITHYAVLLPLIFFVLLTSFIYLRKTKRTFPKLHKFLCIALLLLISLDIFSLVTEANRAKMGITQTTPFEITNCDTCHKPDVYFIVADEYAGNTALRNLLQFNNDSFETSLKRRGFHILNGSSSNYNFTPFSMASVLSMDYLKGIRGINSNKEDRTECNHLIAENVAIRFFKKLGYEIINNSVFTIDNQLPKVRSFAFSLTGRELITSQTLLGRMERDIRFNLMTTFKIKSEITRFTNLEKDGITTLYNETIKEITRIHKKPVFTYTHLMMPHYPYFFDEHGNPNPPDSLLEGNQGSKRMYVGYLKYANARFQGLIDQIIAKSAQPPIIILMGDHGFRHTPTDNTMNYFYNLNAVYFPDRNYKDFADSSTLVNQFRLVLNSQFGQHLPILANKHYLIQD